MFPEIARDDVFRLETRRLWLRWPRASDAPAVSALAGDWGVARWTALIPHPYTIEDAERCILAARAANARGAALRFALTLKDFPCKLVGMAAIEPAEDGPRLGFWLGRPYSGRGLMSEAAQAMADIFFRVTEAERLSTVIVTDNAASRAVLEKCGFGESERFDAGSGRHADSPVVRMTLSRDEWRAPRSAGLRPALAFDTALA
ncbi:GNAT family N-acetyltransferase [Rhodoblastus sp.]|uniref:GNAT family N-acetyltransferase n=1 Tax=Rhodoblastus sp. TaxID=1962975 RepID=UPI003F9AFE32